MAKLVRLRGTISSAGLGDSEVGVIRDSNENDSEVFFPSKRKSLRIKNSALQEIDPANFGDSLPEKICNVCHKILPTEQFEPNQNGKGNRTVRRPSCRECRKKIDGVAMAADDKKKWMATKPNFVDFECPVCHKITIPPVTSKVVLNHSHATGKIIGWICDSCNTGLGRFKDDTEVLLRAAKYLEQH